MKMSSAHQFSWLSMVSMLHVCLFFVLLHGFGSHGIDRIDTFALLSGTLRTFQQVGCDDELITLKCPNETTISIQQARYEKPTLAMCASGMDISTNTTLANTNATCKWSAALKYSVIQTVVEACQKKHQCKFHSSIGTFGNDPCPGVRKYIHVGYKCRPIQFLSTVACENNVIELKCGPHTRIAIYTASYGRTEYESVQCPQPQGEPEETCLASFATEAVMVLCHGKRRCTLAADTATFGNPCRPASRMYLKIVYTCVSRVVFRSESFSDQLEPDELNTTTETIGDFYQEEPITRIEVNRYNESLIKDSHQIRTTETTIGYSNSSFVHQIPSESKNASQLHPPYISRNSPPPNDHNSKDMQGDGIAKVKINERIFGGAIATPTTTTTTITTTSYRSLSSGFFAFTLFFAQNSDQFFLVIIVGASFCIVLVLVILGGHFIINRHQPTNDNDGKYRAGGITGNDHPLSSGFVDDISDINDDIALGTPLPVCNTMTLLSPSPPPLQNDRTRGERSDIVHSTTLTRNNDNRIFSVSGFSPIDNEHHRHHHHPHFHPQQPQQVHQNRHQILQHPPTLHYHPQDGLGYVIPPPDAYQTIRRSCTEDESRVLAHAPDYYYG